MIAGQWAGAEFAVLCRLWEAGAQLGGQVVPYPVQLVGTEVLMEFIGDPRPARRRHGWSNCDRTRPYWPISGNSW